jgi:toxin ParE1/3/4
VRTLRWAFEARDDLVGIVSFIAQDSPVAALSVLDRIESVARRLAEFPTGRVGRVKGTYEAPIAGLPYIVSFAVNESGAEVLVLRIIHGARDWPDGGWPA